MTGPRVLAVDDEPAIGRLLRGVLEPQGYRVSLAATGAEALAALAREPPDLVLLDLGLPDCDGIELIGRIRERSAVPIVVLSSRDDERGKVAALDRGADDYVTKPFGVDELLARLRTALRHRLQEQGAPPALEVGGLRIDLVGRRVARDGREVKLSAREFALLHALARHPGRIVTHRQLLAAVWGGHAVEDVQYLRVYMRQLRRKLEPEPDRPRLLLTEPGIGYRLVLP